MVDVRTPEEFQGGHVNGAINIPLHEVPHRPEEFRAMRRPLLLCCASGNRSGQAAHFLAQQGISHIYNVGGWMDLAWERDGG